MPTVKVFAPEKLPATGVSETRLQIWYDQLICYLEQEDDYALFMDGGAYETWDAAEEFPDRIRRVVGPDAGAAHLTKRRKQLWTFLTIIARACHENDYKPIIKHSKCVKWIVNKLREDHDIQKKGIHFLNLLDITYDQEETTPTAFYNRYRTHFINNLRKQGEIVKWKSPTAIAQDKKMTPLLEDTILFNVLNLIDSRLLMHIREVFALQMGKDLSLRDLKTEILVNIPKMLSEIKTREAAASLVKVNAILDPTAANEEYESLPTA